MKILIAILLAGLVNAAAVLQKTPALTSTNIASPKRLGNFRHTRVKVANSLAPIRPGSHVSERLTSDNRKPDSSLVHRITDAKQLAAKSPKAETECRNVMQDPRLASLKSIVDETAKKVANSKTEERDDTNLLRPLEKNDLFSVIACLSRSAAIKWSGLESGFNSAKIFVLTSAVISTLAAMGINNIEDVGKIDLIDPPAIEQTLQKSQIEGAGAYRMKS